MVTVLPFPGFITYWLPLLLESPGAEALTLLFGIPGIVIDIGLATPRYTTFILSAAISAALGLAMVEKVFFTGSNQHFNTTFF